MPQEFKDIKTNFNEIAAQVHADNVHWWTDPKTGERLDRNRPEMMMLMVSEIAEGMEGFRKNLMDDHLPHLKMEHVELGGDLLIRLLDYCGGWGIDIDKVFAEKRRFNKIRADHKPEARLSENGKKF